MGGDILMEHLLHQLHYTETAGCMEGGEMVLDLCCLEEVSYVGGGPS